MLIMVTRTNTPRSSLGNSFGFVKIDVPDAPLGFAMLSESHYNNFNADHPNEAVSFSDTPGVDAFRVQLHQEVYEREAKDMKFESWVRALDNYSFVTTFFTNTM